MSNAGRLSQIAALIGDPARANMLTCLMDGRWLTAGELAYAARVAPQTASEHLTKLVDGGVLAPARRQGRYRYHRLASHQVAAMLESIMVVAVPRLPVRASAHGGAARHCVAPAPATTTWLVASASGSPRRYKRAVTLH